MSGNEPFQREAQVDKPGIIGAKWWHASLADEDAKIARRSAIKKILVGGAIVAGFGAMLTFCVKAASRPSTPSQPLATTTDPYPAPEDTTQSRQTALALQKDYGWSFGANGQPLAFDGTNELPFDPKAHEVLADVMKPTETALVPFYQSTLFTATETSPKKLQTLDVDEQKAFKLLYPELKPAVTRAMKLAYEKGRSLAALFAALPATPAPKVALVVDLPGPESVAFAAGAAHMFTPVCLFDNWPHPKGIVKAHETLAAALYFEPLFAKEKDDKARKTKRMPMFVLDRRRITPYTDEATQFDNRYIAKLPWPGTQMKALGADNVLYVVPDALDAGRELDDLNDDFVAYAKDGVNVKIVALDRFFNEAKMLDAGAEAGTPDAGKVATADAGADGGIPSYASDVGPLYYGGGPKEQYQFFDYYPVAKNPHPSATTDVYVAPPPGSNYEPTSRKSTYSTGTSGGSPTKDQPQGFATAPVLIAGGTGALIGYQYSQLGRSGSWNRYGGSGYSG